MSDEIKNEATEPVEEKGFFDKMKDKLEDLKDKAEEVWEKVEDKAEDAWDATKEKAAHLKDVVGDKIHDLTDGDKADEPKVDDAK